MSQNEENAQWEDFKTGKNKDKLDKKKKTKKKENMQHAQYII